MMPPAQLAELVERLRFRAILADRCGDHETAADFTEAANQIENLSEYISSLREEVLMLEQTIVNKTAEQQRLAHGGWQG